MIHHFLPEEREEQKHFYPIFYRAISIKHLIKYYHKTHKSKGKDIVDWHKGKISIL